jgi:hypothetical protein
MYEFRTRVNAFEALKRMNHFNEQVCRNLFEATLSFNSRLSNPAKDALAYFKQQSAAQAIMKEVASSSDWTEEQQKALQAIAGN